MSALSQPPVTVIGGGIAGAEAAWQAAGAGAAVLLYEMRPHFTTPLHRTELLGELIGSNSLGVDAADRAGGLLKQELRAVGSFVLRCADRSELAGGRELLVERQAMASVLTDAIASRGQIELRREQIGELPDDGPLVIATGPLTSQPLARALYRRLRQPYRFFYQSTTPIVALDNIHDRGLVPGSPYDPADDMGRNCLLDGVTFAAFCAALAEAHTTLPEECEPRELLDRCLPIEVMARRNPHLLRRGPMNPGRLVDPASGERPAAIVRLVPEDAQGRRWRLFGMGTGLLPEEQDRVFGMLPGLAGLEIITPGQTTRSVFLNAPAILARTGRVRGCEGLFLAGQLAGTANYVEAAATGWLAGVNAARWVQGRPPALFPEETMLGGLLGRLTGKNTENYCPQPVTFGMLPPVPDDADLPKEERRHRQVERSQAALGEFIAEQMPRPAEPLLE